MARPDTAKPATDIGEPAPNSEQLGGPLSVPHTSHTANVQELRCDFGDGDIAIAGDLSARGALDMCRRMMAAGADPSAELVCYRNGRIALRIRSLADGAKLVVRETSADGPRFASWRPFPAARSGRPFVEISGPSIPTSDSTNAPGPA
jgi:hypothetical protein